MIRLLVGSTDPLAAAGLRALLDGLPDIAVIATGQGIAETVALARSLHPDVLLFDSGGTNHRTDDVPEQLRDPELPYAIVLLADAAGNATAGRALGAGVRGYLLRGSTTIEMAAAVRAAADGLVSVQPAVALALARPWVATLADTHTGSVEPLTVREREVLQLLAEGLANKQIALRLGISEHTAKFHVAEVMAKLGAGSRTEAVARAARSGLLAL